MTASQQLRIRGTCPGALQPMAAEDGLIVRIRPPSGRLTQSQASALATLAQRYADGKICLTSRANVQLRGVTASDYPQLLASLQCLSLIDASVTQERRRNVVQTPFWKTGDASQQIGEELEHALRAADAIELPAKFGFAVDCGDTPVLCGTSADIRIQRSVDGRLLCVADGMQMGAYVSIDTAASKALSLACWFLDNAGAPKGRGRMASLVLSGVNVPPGYHEGQAMSCGDSVVQPGQHDTGWLVAPEFGQMASDDLYALAQLGVLRLTPWRMLLIEGVHSDPAAHLITGVENFLTPHDPRLNVFVCTGAPGCIQANAPTRQLARTLARHIPQGAQLHVSGCSKGCAHPGSVANTVVATPNNEFSFVQHGKASDSPKYTHLSATTLIANSNLFVD